MSRNRVEKGEKSDSALVTGGAGFVGLHLVKRILNETDWHILVVDNFDRARKDSAFGELLENPRVSLHDIDLTDLDSVVDLPDVEWIFHLAAVVGVKNVESRPTDVLEINALSTINIARYAQSCHRLKCLLFSSTSEVYAGTLEHFGIPIPTPETTPIALSDIFKTRTSYALSKLFGEAVLHASSANAAYRSIVVRYHNVYGPRMGYMHVIPELLDRMRKEDEIEVFSPKHTRAFCFVEDAVRITLHLALYGEASGVYNVGNSHCEITMLDLAKKIRSVGGFNCQLSGGRDNPGSPVRRCPDISKVQHELGSQTFCPLDTGLRETIEWYQIEGRIRYE